MKTLLRHKQMRLIFMGFALSMMQIVFVNAQTLDTRFKIPVAQKFARFNAINASADGKVVAAGYFLFYGNQPVNEFVRLSSTGGLDASFKPPTWLPMPDFIEIYSNGDVLNVTSGDGNHQSLIRLSGRNGNYLTGTETNVPDNITDVLILPDNSVILTAYGRVVKFTKDLQLDPIFKANNVEFNGWVTGIERQGTKFIVVGSFNHVGDVDKNDVIRLNADGSIDNSFDAGSGVSGDNWINGVTVQPDNKILLNGNLSNFNGSWICGLVRLNADGSVDDSFDSPNYEADYLSSAVRNNRIYVSTNSSTFRLLMDGSVDEAFSTVGFETEFENFVVLKDGSLIAAGEQSGVVKYNAKGQQAKFNAPLTDQGTITDVAKLGKRVVIRGDFSMINNIPANAVALLNDKGQPDPNFFWPFGALPVRQMEGTDDTHFIMNLDDCCGGLYRFDVNNIFGYNFLTADRSYPLNSDIQKFKALPDGKILAATQYGVARINPNGSRDYSFHGAEVGNNSHDIGFDVDENWRIVFGSRVYYYNGSAGGMVRLNSDGTVDNRYTAGFGPNAAIEGIAALPGGDVVAFGGFDYWNDNSDISSDIRSLSSGPELLVSEDPGTYIPYGIVKIKNNGKIDTQFQQNVNSLLGNGFIAQIISFRRMVLIQAYNYSNGGYQLLAINPDGTVNSGLLPRNITGVWDVSSVNVLDNNTLVLTGLFTVKGQPGLAKMVKISYPNTIPVKAQPVEAEVGRVATVSDDNTTPSGLRVYPNPTSDFISLDTDRATNVSIFTLDGQIKINSKVSGAGDKIDIRGLKPGRYVVKINTNGKVRTEQFIVK
jgi:uncharacterized delta-60 repeat protein